MFKITNLSFSYQHRRLFDELSFVVEAGEVLHVRGANGVGKSTLLSVIAGLLEQDSGEVQYLSGDAVVKDRREFVEYLPAESNGLFLKMDAVSNLSFWGSLRGASVDREKVHSLLERWNLNHPILRDSLPVEKYSTGMKRRLTLARLELSSAKCWLLDEPVYGLDQEAEAVFKESLRSHIDRGGSIVIVSHSESIVDGLGAKTLDIGNR